MNRRLYSRLVYSMAYVCAVAIFAFSSAGIPNDLLIAFAIACLVAGGWLNTDTDEKLIEPQQEPQEHENLTTIDQEMSEARQMAEAQV